MKYELEKYQEKYFEYLYLTKKDCFQWYVEKAYGKWEDEFQIKFFKDDIEKNRDHIKVIMHNNKPIGFFTNYVDENNESVISLFYIDKKYQGKGIGTQILQEQLEKDEKNNRNTILRVFKENPAKVLYERVGFKIYDETEFHYKMRRKLGG